MGGCPLYVIPVLFSSVRLFPCVHFSVQFSTLPLPCYSHVIRMLLSAPPSVPLSACDRPAIVLQQSAIVCGLSFCSLRFVLLQSVVCALPSPRDSLLLPACHHVLFYFILFYLILPAVVTGRVFLFPHRVLPLHSVLFSSSLMRGIVPSSFRIAVFPVPSLYLQSMPCSLCVRCVFAVFPVLFPVRCVLRVVRCVVRPLLLSSFGAIDFPARPARPAAVLWAASSVGGRRRLRVCARLEFRPYSRALLWCSSSGGLLFLLLQFCSSLLGYIYIARSQAEPRKDPANARLVKPACPAVPRVHSIFEGQDVLDRQFSRI